ncbi:hypothetical protein ACIHEI_19035 [Kitasatospora sp. NPDC051984]|uniref:hypothetical protein n=1 Tax=Kitasatospora sp. NPDC051984 TaxID=3364059 RepID=UPI0037C9E398
MSTDDSAAEAEAVRVLQEAPGVADDDVRAHAALSVQTGDLTSFTATHLPQA